MTARGPTRIEQMTPQGRAIRKERSNDNMHMANKSKKQTRRNRVQKLRKMPKLQSSTSKRMGKQTNRRTDGS